MSKMPRCSNVTRRAHSRTCRGGAVGSRRVANAGKKHTHTGRAAPAGPAAGGAKRGRAALSVRRVGRTRYSYFQSTFTAKRRDAGASVSGQEYKLALAREWNEHKASFALDGEYHCEFERRFQAWIGNEAADGDLGEERRRRVTSMMRTTRMAWAAPKRKPPAQKERTGAPRGSAAGLSDDEAFASGSRMPSQRRGVELSSAGSASASVSRLAGLPLQRLRLSLTSVSRGPALQQRAAAGATPRATPVASSAPQASRRDRSARSTASPHAAAAVQTATFSAGADSMLQDQGPGANVPAQPKAFGDPLGALADTRMVASHPLRKTLASFATNDVTHPFDFPSEDWSSTPWPFRLPTEIMPHRLCSNGEWGGPRNSRRDRPLLRILALTSSPCRRGSKKNDNVGQTSTSRSRHRDNSVTFLKEECLLEAGAYGFQPGGWLLLEHHGCRVPRSLLGGSNCLDVSVPEGDCFSIVSMTDLGLEGLHKPDRKCAFQDWSFLWANADASAIDLKGVPIAAVHGPLGNEDPSQTRWRRGVIVNAEAIATDSIHANVSWHAANFCRARQCTVVLEREMYGERLLQSHYKMTATSGQWVFLLDEAKVSKTNGPPIPVSVVHGRLHSSGYTLGSAYGHGHCAPLSILASVGAIPAATAATLGEVALAAETTLRRLAQATIEAGLSGVLLRVAERLPETAAEAQRVIAEWDGGSPHLQISSALCCLPLPSPSSVASWCSTVAITTCSRSGGGGQHAVLSDGLQVLQRCQRRLIQRSRA